MDYQYTSKVFDEYEKRFAEARMARPLRDPSCEKDRREILREARDMLCLDRIPTPTIEILKQKEERHNGVTVRILQFRSWAHCYGEATLLLPDGEPKARPAILICIGHSPDGRLGEAYQKMAFRLAMHGYVVLASDNLGQGSRKKFVHWDAEAPLCAGITLQGMIVAESNAWIEWLANQPFVDPGQIGACGNSGGGTLTLFLTATNKRLSAVASCGYPSTFSYVHQKEKKHCCCNLFKGCAHLADMWEIYSAFAPKPLMLNCGECDSLFPADIFRSVARKVRTVYAQTGNPDALTISHTNTLHPWASEDIDQIAEFFCRHFPCTTPDAPAESISILEPGCRFAYPEDAISTNQLAGQILGVEIDEGITLADVYPPTYCGEPVDRTRLANDIFAYDPMRILAQMEMALTR